MEITLFNSAAFNSTIRCAIRCNGKLTFSLEAIWKLNLRNKRFIGIGKDEKDTQKNHFYMYVYEKYHENAFVINWSGEYCYLNTKELFDQFDYGYSSKYLYFNIIEAESSNEDKLYKLIGRVKRRTRFSSKD